MNIRATFITSSFLIATILISGAAQAALIGRDINGSLDSFEAYFDDDLNITWLYHGYSVKYDEAYSIATNISFTDGVNTYNNWRLPTTLQPDVSCDTQLVGYGSVGFDCTGSEMGHLFYSELGGTARQSILTSSDPDLAKFPYLEAEAYWSNGRGLNDAWVFDFWNGGQGSSNKGNHNYLMLVSPGDVGRAIPNPNVVSVPATLSLVGLGLVGLGAMRRRE